VVLGPGLRVVPAELVGTETRTHVSSVLLKTKPLGHSLQIGDPLSHVTKMFGLFALSWKTEPSGFRLQRDIGPVV